MGEREVCGEYLLESISMTNLIFELSYVYTVGLYIVYLLEKSVSRRLSKVSRIFASSPDNSGGSVRTTCME
jgi:hypothetical protein